MRAAGWDPNQGGAVAFGDFERRNLQSPKDRQEWFIENLYRKLQEAKSGRPMPSMAELDAVFKIDGRWSSESVGKINKMVSDLCAMPKGREILLALFEKAQDNGFQVRFTPQSGNFYASCPKMDGQQPFVEVGMDLSIFGGNLVKMLFLVFDGKNYGTEKVTYPPFIALAHEFGHLVHFMDTYEALRDKYGDTFPVPPSSLTSSINQWRDFTQVVCADKGYPGFFQKGDDVTRQQAAAYRVCSRRKLDDIILEGLGLERTDANLKELRNFKLALGFLGEGSQEEMLNIMCDPRFNDRIFLEDACKCGLLQLPQEIIRNGIRLGCRSDYPPANQTPDEYRDFIENDIIPAVRFWAPLLPEGLRPPGLRPPLPPELGPSDTGPTGPGNPE
ncbi:MAG: hypothetical protein LBF94_02300 [Puniceicoccales bacterium]|jgi:hypothetical protein|nr:hypothetical protein [Puniceicoccales bacterium]